MPQKGGESAKTFILPSLLFQVRSLQGQLGNQLPCPSLIPEVQQQLRQVEPLGRRQLRGRELPSQSFDEPPTLLAYTRLPGLQEQPELALPSHFIIWDAGEDQFQVVPAGAGDHRITDSGEQACAELPVLGCVSIP